MSILLILILIPLFCITVSLFIMSLFNYLTLNELDIVMITSAIFLILVFGFILMRLLIKNCKENSVILLNLENKLLSIFGFYSFNVIALFGITLVLNSLIYNFKIFYFVIGTIIFIFYIWIFIAYILKNKKKVFTITMIDKINNHIDLMYLRDEKHEYELYIKHDIKYVEEQSYLCKYNSMSKEIRKIIKKVIEVENNNE